MVPPGPALDCPAPTDAAAGGHAPGDLARPFARPLPLTWEVVCWLLLSLRMLIDAWLRAFSRRALL